MKGSNSELTMVIKETKKGWTFYKLRLFETKQSNAAD